MGRSYGVPPERPKLVLPIGLRERLEPDRETIGEVLRRAAIFREQAMRFIRENGRLQVLALPGHLDEAGCLSCGDLIPGRCYRCELCALAVTLALEEIP